MERRARPTRSQTPPDIRKARTLRTHRPETEKRLQEPPPSHHFGKTGRLRELRKQLPATSVRSPEHHEGASGEKRLLRPVSLGSDQRVRNRRGATLHARLPIDRIAEQSSAGEEHLRLRRLRFGQDQSAGLLRARPVHTDVRIGGRAALRTMRMREHRLLWRASHVEIVAGARHLLQIQDRALAAGFAVRNAGHGDPSGHAGDHTAYGFGAEPCC